MKTARSWTHVTDTDRKAMHDFSNMLQEFQSAVERDDAKVQQWAVGELQKMYAAALKNSTKENM